MMDLKYQEKKKNEVLYETNIIDRISWERKINIGKKLAEIKNYPLLHLDRIFHIDHLNHISREELLQKITAFAEINQSFIIDGSYKSTLKERLALADTVIFLKIDTKTCLENIENRRLSNEPRSDMASGFDSSYQDPDFYRYVKAYQIDQWPLIYQCLKPANHVRLIELDDYDEIALLIEKLKKD